MKVLELQELAILLILNKQEKYILCVKSHEEDATPELMAGTRKEILEYLKENYEYDLWWMQQDDKNEAEQHDLLDRFLKYIPDYLIEEGTIHIYKY